MKLKKNNTQTSAAPAQQGGAIIADRFRLDVDPNAGRGPEGVSKTAATVAMIAALVTTALMGAVAALMYVNWELIKDV